MKKLTILFLGFLLLKGFNTASAQVQLDDSEESEMMLILEYAVKEHLIKPIDARINDRYISEDEGDVAIVIECNRSGVYSEKYLKEKLHEFTEMEGDFGPKSGFKANTDIVVPWRTQENKHGINEFTVWLLYEKTHLAILLAEEEITFMITPKNSSTE